MYEMIIYRNNVRYKRKIMKNNISLWEGCMMQDYENDVCDASLEKYKWIYSFSRSNKTNYSATTLDFSNNNYHGYHRIEYTVSKIEKQ